MKNSDFTESPAFQRFPKRIFHQYNAQKRNIDRYPLFFAKILKILSE
ncbi:hypothetical protein [Methanobrevibacter sp.]|nr:hypothetical protein [Methanobrevibacter sp.]MEE1335766.1 hypothetical protein [Methanobrevibacter sp.]